MVKIGNYDYEKSTRKDKKLMVRVEGKLIHFGSKIPLMEHYKDKTKIYKELDHLDEKRRQMYIARASGIKNKKGELTKDDPTTANFHALRILWMG